MNFFIRGTMIFIVLVVLCGCGKRTHQPSPPQPPLARHEKRSLYENIVDFWFYRIRTVERGKCYRSGQLSYSADSAEARVSPVYSP